MTIRIKKVIRTDQEIFIFVWKLFKRVELTKLMLLNAIGLLQKK